MYKVVIAEEEIKKYQDIFIKIIQQKTEVHKDKKIGFPSNSRKCDVYWSPEEKFWSTSFIVTKKGNRHVNWFGITEPRNKNNLSIDVEINFSIKGSRAASKFAVNENNVLIVHDGNIGTNRKEGPIIFWKHYKGEHISINGKDLALIGELPSDASQYADFRSKIKKFILEIERIKNIAKGENKDSDFNIGHNQKQQIAGKKSKQKLPANIKHEVLNKAFGFIQSVLPNYIGKNLQNYDKNNWWENQVIKKLHPGSIENLPRNGNYNECIGSLDISLCLKIIIENWHNVFKHINKDIKFSWVHELIEIRNDVSHWTNKKAEIYNFESIRHALNVMKLFILSVDINASEKISEIIKEFEANYEN